MTEATDVDLLQAYLGGDPAAFGIFYRRHVRLMFGYLYHATGNRSDAEDMLQEVFLQAARGARRMLAMAKPRLYLYGIARNACRDLQQSRRQTARLQSDLKLTLNQRGRLQGRQPEDIEHLQRALFELPADQREVIRLHAIDGLTLQETAEITGEPLNTTLYRYYAGLKKMKEKLHGHLDS